MPGSRFCGYFFILIFSQQRRRIVAGMSHKKNTQKNSGGLRISTPLSKHQEDKDPRGPLDVSNERFKFNCSSLMEVSEWRIYTPRELTWQWKITISNWRYRCIFKKLFCHCHVSFRGFIIWNGNTFFTTLFIFDRFGKKTHWSLNLQIFGHYNERSCAPNIHHMDPHSNLGGGFKCLLFSPLLGEDFHFDKHIFQMGGSTTN